MIDTYIFGAKATAAGAYKALELLEPDLDIRAFLVSKADDNAPELWGRPVRSLAAVSEELSEDERAHDVVYAAVPELIHKEVKALLSGAGFTQLVMLDSRTEARLMERYYAHERIFPSLHSLPYSGNGTDAPKLCIYAVVHDRDKPLESPPVLPPYAKKILVGCTGARERGVAIEGKADFYDDEGDNISAKNPIRSEMTAHYWIWKNRLHADDAYVGVCHYRRMLDLSAEDLLRIGQNDIDAVLPFPMIHYPNCGIHHTWYVKEGDWTALRTALHEIHPEYEAHWDEVFSQPYFYNYNLILAKKSVFADYCAWLFPVLDRMEELSVPKGPERTDRYTGYLCEDLMTLYFLTRREKLRLYHTGRLLYI